MEQSSTIARTPIEEVAEFLSTGLNVKAKSVVEISRTLLLSECPNCEMKCKLFTDKDWDIVHCTCGVNYIVDRPTKGFKMQRERKRRERKVVEEQMIQEAEWI